MNQRVSDQDKIAVEHLSRFLVASCRCWDCQDMDEITGAIRWVLRRLRDLKEPGGQTAKTADKVSDLMGKRAEYSVWRDGKEVALGSLSEIVHYLVWIKSPDSGVFEPAGQEGG